MVRSRYSRTGLKVTGIGLGILLVSGCLSISEMAPPVEGPLVSTGTDLGYDEARLIAGREIYLTECIECHGIIPIRNYSLDRWKQVLPDMSERSGLSLVEQENLGAYIESVLAGPASGPTDP